MQIIFQFEAQLSQVAGTREQRLELSAPVNVQSAVQQAAEQGTSALRDRLLTVDGTVQKSLMVFVNDAPVTGDAASHELHDHDTVLLLPPISGG